MRIDPRCRVSSAKQIAVAMLLIWAFACEALAANNSLASVVPPTAGFFIELDRIAGDGSSGRADVANQVLELLVGSADVRRGLSANLQRALEGLGIERGRTTRELATRRIAIAAPSWKELARGVLIVRLRKNDDLIKQIFTPESRESISSRKKVIIYPTERLLSAATDGEVLIISQGSSEGSLFEQTVRLLTNDTEASLADQPDFRQRVSALPPFPSGLVYVNAADADQLRLPTLNLDLSKLAIGMYLRSDSVEFAFQVDPLRHSMVQPTAAAAFARARTLPQTTVVAWCTSVDTQSAYQSLLAHGADSNAPALIRMIFEAFDVESSLQDVIPRLGPRAIFVWDHHLGTGPELPQVAVLFESEDATGCAVACGQAVQAVVDWMDLKSPGSGGSRLGLSQSEYLGVPVFELILPEARAPSAGPPGVRRGFSPAFAAVEEWFIIAASADHIRNIIDAQWSMAPRLADLGELASLADDAKKSSTVAVAQPRQAAQVMGSWLDKPKGTVAGWLGDVLGADNSPVEHRRPAPRLGIGMKPGRRPGTVLVARVYPNGQAHGRLLPGDLIIGVNGRLLSLARPRRDLRRNVTKPQATGRWTFRVQRQSATLDVIVPTGVRPALRQGAVDPAGALRQLQRLFSLVDFASVRVIRSTPDRLSAVLALRFTPAASTP